MPEKNNKKQTNKQTKKTDKIVRDIWRLFEPEEDYIISLKEEKISRARILSNMEVMVIKIETYLQTNILTKLNLNFEEYHN